MHRYWTDIVDDEDDVDFSFSQRCGDRGGRGGGGGRGFLGHIKRCRRYRTRTLIRTRTRAHRAFEFAPPSPEDLHVYYAV